MLMPCALKPTQSLSSDPSAISGCEQASMPMNAVRCNQAHAAADDSPVPHFLLSVAIPQQWTNAHGSGQCITALTAFMQRLGSGKMVRNVKMLHSMQVLQPMYLVKVDHFCCCWLPKSAQDGSYTHENDMTCCLLWFRPHQQQHCRCRSMLTATSPQKLT